MSELMTLSRSILQRKKAYEGATGDFTLLLNHIALAAKVVSRRFWADFGIVAMGTLVSGLLGTLLDEIGFRPRGVAAHAEIVRRNHRIAIAGE